MAINRAKSNDAHEDGTEHAEEVVIDFGKPFKKISIIEEIEKITNTRLPDLNKPGIGKSFYKKEYTY